MRRSGFRAVSELGPPDPRVFGFIWELGELGEARRDDMVFVQGELWRARPAGGEPLRPGQQVRVTSVGPELTLVVEPVAK